MEIETVIGDTTYSEKDNIRYAKKNELELISKLNPKITHGTRTKENEFELNKDTGMYVCKAGHMAIRKARIGKEKTLFRSISNEITSFQFWLTYRIYKR